MIPSSHKVHADLLARAREALSADERRDPNVHDRLLAELAHAERAFAVSPLLWPVTLCVGIVEHRHGINLHVAHDRLALDRDLASFCREWWPEISDPRDPAMIDDQTVIERYFDGHDHESLTVEVTDLQPAAMSAAATVEAGLERGRYCVLSTAHLTSVTGDLLDVWASWPPGQRPLDIAAAVHGWFVPTRPIAPERTVQLPEDLAAVMLFGRERGFDYVLIDCDGDEVDGLKVHSW
jgi:hypothetical protein